MNSAPEISTGKQLHLQTTLGTVTQNSHVTRRRSKAGRSRRSPKRRTAAVIGWRLSPSALAFNKCLCNISIRAEAGGRR